MCIFLTDATFQQQLFNNILQLKGNDGNGEIKV